MGSKKAKRLTGRHPLAYTGVEPLTPPNLAIEKRTPTTHDLYNFNIGAIWVVRNDSLSKEVYMLIDKQGGIGEWVLIYPSSGMPVGGLDGQVIIGKTGLDPVWNYITSLDTSISIVGGAGTIDLSLTFDSDFGTAIPSSGLLNIVGGAGMVTSGSADTITVSSRCANEIRTDFNNVAIQLDDPNWFKVTGLKTASGVTTYPTPNNNIHTYGGSTSGGLNIALNRFIEWPDTIVTVLGILGSIQLGGDTFMHNFSENSTWLGKGAGSTTSTTANRNTGIGFGVMSDVTTAEFNVGVGSGALSNLTTGSENTSVGRNSMNDATVAEFNVGVGSGVLSKLTTGSENTSVGRNSMNDVTVGQKNTAIGQGSLAVIVGQDNNVALGYEAGKLTDGSSNIIIGHDGISGESHRLRIGTHGTGGGEQNATYIAGINGNGLQSGSKRLVYIDGDHEVGTGSSYTPGYVYTDGGGVVHIFNPPHLPNTYSQGILRCKDDATSEWSNNSGVGGRVLISGDDGIGGTYPKWRKLTEGAGTTITETNFSITIGNTPKTAFFYGQDGDSPNRTGDGTFARLGNVLALTKRYDNLSGCSSSGNLFTAPITQLKGVYHLSMVVTLYNLEGVAPTVALPKDPLQITTSNRIYRMTGLPIQYLASPGNVQTFQLSVDADMDAGDTASFAAALLTPLGTKTVGFRGKSGTTVNRESTFMYGHLVEYTYS